VAPDWRVIGFTVLLTLVAVLAAGLLPALHAGGTDLISTLKNDGTVFGRKLSQSRLRNLLVISQVAVCLMLLSCAGLLARNLIELRKVDAGFDPHAIFLVDATPRTAVPDRRMAAGQAVELLNSLPGVVAASLAAEAPLLGRSSANTLARPSGSLGAVAPIEKIQSFRVGQEFFRTFGIPVLRGRAFTAVEMELGARAVVVSESTARRWWAGGDAVGKTLTIDAGVLGVAGAQRGVDFVECEVVGVVRDVLSRVDSNDRGVVYLPFPSGPPAPAAILLRPRSDSPAALADLAQAAEAAGFTLQFRVRLSDFLTEQMLPFYGLAVLSGALGGLALLMASVGIYGVMAFGVNQRVREIGIRIALGATARNVAGLFVRQGMRLVAAGIVAGLIGGALFALLLAKVLFGLSGAFDPVAFGGVTLIFTAVALVACWLPARRAAKVDPMVALRAE
jgi:putative ABC transport system permease protein